MRCSVVAKASLQPSFCKLLHVHADGSYGNMKIVPKKKKSKRFTAVAAVKELARDRIGRPPVSRVVPDKRQNKAQKHKPTISKLLDNTEGE